ncbi:type I polyketide synthase [Actinomadura rifamycini]|uniref:type I polyketide synthase n=1 Tax=Actinomadura rifamycini TaxID=31962 RepID=UPI00042A2653|nr:type I polyketide synthase [Actinomadura rifamycini]
MGEWSRPEDAVAIVGAACRLPGGITDLDGLWEALLRGADLVGEVPPDRFDVRRFVDERVPRPDRSYTRAGGFLDDVSGFDAAYFGIAPKEAATMDPQQRLLLEMAAEALDDAGIAPGALAGTDAGVFVGLSDPAYGTLQALEPGAMGPYSMSGAALSIASNRLSYVFDLRGPSMSIDTACSSALVAVERAVRALAEGSGRVMLAGGVNALLGPGPYVGFSQASMLSPTGRCRAFSAHADGFVRAEGGGVVLLKRLADAIGDGDRIHAVIVGAASNNDGRTMGLALPNPAAQEDLLRRVYSGLDADDLVYVEAHGTGTAAGDPAECEALGRALGRRRTRGPLPIGSVKTNVGHLEPASGMPGLFKALLVLRHGTIPPSLHADEPNPAIDFAGLGLRVATRAMPAGDRARPLAGVNSFGFGGANAHVALAPPPVPAPVPPSVPAEPDGRALPVVVSARSPEALDEAVARASGHLESVPESGFYDAAYTAARRRGLHPHRAVVLAGSAKAAARGLGDAVRAEAVEHGRVALVFSGNGSQWAGMGADLLEDAVFRAAVEAVDVRLAPRLGRSVLDGLASVRAEGLRAAETAQPLLFAVQAGLAAMLDAAGVRPVAVLGHSVGEVAAAYVSGALSLEQAAQVVAERSLAQAPTRGRGRMAALGLPEDEARRMLADHPGLEIAAVNSDRDVTAAGPADALKALGARLAADGVFFRELDLDYAFHSAAMDPVRDRLCETLAGLRPGRARVPMVSAVTGGPVEGPELDAGYWWRNVREPVRFADAAARVLADGADVLLEVGPHPVLRSYLRRVSGAARGRTAVVGTLRRGEPGPARVRDAVAELVAVGADLDWGVHFPRRGAVADLPAYPWRRERFWVGGPDTWTQRGGAKATEHPLLGTRLPAPEPAWFGEMDPARAPWLLDHRAAGAAVMPATGYVEMAVAAARLAVPGAAEAVEVDRVEISRAMVIPSGAEAEPVWAQTSLSTETGVLTVAGSDRSGGQPREHVRARVRPLLRPAPAPLDADALRARAAEPVDVAGYYAAAAEGHMVWGPEFRVLTELRRGDGEIFAAYRCPAQAEGDYRAHPVVLDSALQAGVLWLVDELRAGTGYMPAAIGAVRVWEAPSVNGLLHVRERPRTEDEVCWDIAITDLAGRVAVEIEGCRLRRMPARSRTPLARYATVLRAAPRPGPAAAAPAVPAREVLADAEAAIAALRPAWDEQGHAAHADRLEEVFAHTLARALADAFGEPAGGRPLDDVLRECAVPHLRRMVRAAVPLLERHGVLEEDRIRPAWSARDVERAHRDLLERSSSFAALSVLAVCRWRELPRLLRGERPAEPVESGGGAELLRQVRDAGPLALLAGRAVAAVAERIVRRWPADRPLRVLEVGAGTGGATASVLPVLPPDRTRYTVTDPDGTSVAQLAKRFGDDGRVEHRVLDLDRDPAEQGFAAGAFDVVVAAGGLYRARDAAVALDRLAALLVPGGTLLAAEPHRLGPLLAVDGQAADFWDVTDRGLRPDSPLLAPERWDALLAEAGFAEVARTDDGDPAGGAWADGDLTVAVATAAGAPAAERPGPEEPPAPDASACWVVAAEDGPSGLPRALRDVLEARGGAAGACPASGDPERWLADVPADARAVGFVLVLGDGPGGPAERVARRLAALRAAARAADRLPDGADAALWVVARPCGALPEPALDGVATHPEDAAVWGAARTLGNEQPGLTVRRVCLYPGGDDGADAGRLAAELLAPDDEDELVLAPRGRFVPRLVEAEPAAAARPAARELAVDDPGLSFALAWREAPVREPGPGEVRIAARAIGLNYRDVMRAVNLLPVEAIENVFGGHELGLECAGIVTAVGAGVTAVRPGDRVTAVGNTGFGDQVVVADWMAAPVPDGMTFAEAATLPIAFATALYSLEVCARLREGETVLVHGGAGGVGLAALQVARAFGARVVATAGTPVKRELLRALGADHVLDSRSLHFAERVRELTGGRGVDVVLNSLAGEAVTRSLETLAHGGRFIELGKRDIYENRPLLLRPFGENLAFHGVDIGTLLWKAPEDAARHLAALAALARSGEVRPLPHTLFPAARVQDAFTLMRHSRHVGKIVVSLDPRDEPVRVRSRRTPPRFDPEATYLVTGGLGGFGAETSRWLVRHGARHLALVGRRGAAAPGAAALLGELDGLGARARAHAADAADAGAMRRVFREADAAGRPVRGVVHAAMHLDDAPLTDLDDERIRAVLHPKIAGAAVLDGLTRDRDLDLFVLCSSLTTIGNVGQAPYVAANLYLEALARRRRRDGLPALAVGLGALAGTGVLATGDRERVLARAGIDSITPAEALAAVGDMLAEGVDVGMVGRCDWARLGRVLPALRRPWLSRLVPAGLEEDDASATELARLVAGAGADEAHALVAERLVQVLAAVLLTPAERIAHDRRLDDYGLDSLMATELLSALRGRFGVEIPPMELLRSGGTVNDIARLIVLRLGAAAPAARAAEPAPPPQRPQAVPAPRRGEGSPSPSR